MQELRESGKMIEKLIELGWPGVIFLIISSFVGLIGLIKSHKKGKITIKSSLKKEQIENQAKLPLTNISDEDRLEKAEAELEMFLDGEKNE